MHTYLYGAEKSNKFLEVGDNRYGLSKLAYNFLGGVMKACSDRCRHSLTQQLTAIEG